MKITFVDAGVLIAASRGLGDVARRAREVIDDPDRVFASSEFVKLEVLPKPIYEKRETEADFYREFFAAVRHWAGPVEKIVNGAYDVAQSCGMSAMDALHVAAAEIAGASELVTTERPEKPIHRAKRVIVRSISV